ncbi:MAG: PEGA domain-containing protein [Bryobacterales bacterium]|nr:PEGA domain-containing protein [Bryobacterales bacterium]
MSSPVRVSDRYELGEALGRGGMGVVYKAYDSLMKRHVALKTILDVENSIVLDLFYKEWGVQAAIVHPNVAEIYDIGEFEENGAKKPFFVMPLLPGVGLDVLIAEKSPRLTVERVVHIFNQTCRGLQAAHERGLIHRDLKPSNIFVMEDDSVKLIDFGIAHVAETGAKTSLKGTLSYMAPEQLKMEGPSAKSDIFSLGVTCYETLAGIRPFRGKTDHEISQAILHLIPPAVSEVNGKVSETISQVIHKALAKDPWHRFATAREFGDALVKAMRNEPLEIFSAEKIQPRIERSSKAFEEGDYEFAQEILSELEAEGRLDPQITFLRRRLDQAVKQTQIQKLLESARRYQEAQEHGLALRKVQEALDLDSDDSDAQALQHAIEKERREKQIGEWMTLARKHFENDAFGPARQAIKSILEVKPTETEALRLQSEIDRREREIEQLRQEKAKLYDSARQAFDRGDVTAALSRLEHLVDIDDDSPETGSGRSGTYKQFYQQVRSEHDELKSALDRARSLLAEDNFSEALALCNQRLAKYPNHALFQALRYDVEQRQRQKLSSYIADVDRQLDSEKDLDKRLAILEQALEKYPDEAHFQQAAKLVRDRRDLVNSIASKAQFFEEKGRFQEALDQWEILRSIHPQFESLDLRVDELRKKREEQKIRDEKTRVTERIDRLVENSDFDGAGIAVAEALEAYPDDPTIQELQRLIDKSRERTRLASTLLTAGREAIESGEVDKGLDALREARRTNDGDPIVRSVLINALIEQARKRLSDDRDRAEALLAEALEYDPDNQTAQVLRGQLQDRKKEEFLTWALTEARRLHAENDIDGAAAIVEQGLALYPGDQRLEQLRATLDRARERTGHGVTPALGEEPKTRILPAPPLNDAPGKDDPDKTLVLPIDATSIAPPPKPPAPPPGPNGAANPAGDGGFATQMRKVVGADATKDAANKNAAKKDGPKPAVLAMLVGGGLAIGLIIILFASGFFSGSASEPDPAPIAGDIPVTVQTSPPGAAVTVDGRPCPGSPCTMSLAQGQHQLEASMAGYSAALLEVDIDAANPPGDKPFSLLLDPLLPSLEISSDLESAQVKLDGESVGQLDQGQLQIENIPAGEHELIVEDRGARLTATIEVEAGRAPIVRNVKTTSLKALLVSSLGEDAQAHSDSPNAEAQVDGSAAGQFGDDGVELSGLAAGPHELKVGEGNDALNLYFDSSPRPMLAAMLKSDRNVGGLRITTGMDDVTVLLNGKPYRRKTSNGRVLVYLVPGTLKVSVQKDGFIPPPEQSVEVVKGRQASLEFNLEPLPKTASLRIRNSVAGAEVRMDGKKVGEIASNGEFFAANVKPGKHKIELLKENFERREIEERWKEGQTVEISGALQSITGTLQVSVQPGNVKNLAVTLLREGESAPRPISERSLTVPEGTYTVTARAPGYKEFAATLRVTRGQTRTAELRLEALPQEKAAPKAAFELDDWVSAGVWSKQGDVFVKRGGDFVLVPRDLGAGSYAFSVWLQTGRRTEFVADYQDDKNYILYEVDKKNIARTRYVNGRKTDENKSEHGADTSAFLSFQVDVSANRIAVRLRNGDRWSTLDEYTAGDNLADGKFGFHIGGRTQLALSHFTFFPR